MAVLRKPNSHKKIINATGNQIEKLIQTLIFPKCSLGYETKEYYCILQTFLHERTKHKVDQS